MLFRSTPGRTLAPLQVDAADVEAWIVAKDPAAIGSYREFGAEEYARAFTAARTAGADVVDDLYFGLADTFARQGTEADFERAVTPILKAKGWLGGDDGQIAYRVRLIYDTNLRLARGAGRWERYQNTKAVFPYLRGFTVGDDRVRQPPKSPHADHTAFQDIILPVDHPFWRTYWTPLGFRCRCGIMQMTRSQLARSKHGVTSDEELERRIARLGPPVFLAPGQPISAQLAAMVESTNERRMHGAPIVNPVETAREGANAWAAILAGSLADDAARAIAKLFGL